MTDAAEVTIAGLSVSRETIAALKAFEALVLRWNPAINLVSKATVPDIWQRHIVDSAQLFVHCPKAVRLWLDVGAGGGFPGLVIAILARETVPGLQVVLVESDLRKATFLRQAARTLELPVAVHAERIETLPPMNADVISARALAPLSQLLGFAQRHLSPAGIALFPKGTRYADEVAEAQKNWDFEFDSRPSLSEAGSAILVIRKINRARQD
ncbi:16S rRNA (guanine(527)-N(7))-methyltransferase RsmG [Tabrizicola sp.]|uniref:16S rRNA (guanine(527)-N(7))-methyltransferase RsmG n=1 Tax=Tabrizicola sp. TaxID=2005166 RepID=UPI003F398DD1